MSELSVRDVMRYIEREVAPLSYALPGDRNGLEFGSADMKVKGMVVSWSPNLDVINKTIDLGANLIIAHEWLVYRYLGNKWIEKELPTSDKKVNLNRTKLLTEHEISVLKYHSNLDIAPGGIADSFCEHLGFNKLLRKGKLVRVYEETPVKLSTLARFVLKKLEIPFVRVYGDLERKVSHVGIAVGGLGQIFTYADDFVNAEAEVIIFGEALAYSEIYCYESGYSCIVTSHEASEDPGMRKLAQLLKKRFPETMVTYTRSSMYACIGGLERNIRTT